MPSSSFFWFDLMTPDVAGARSFYGALTGWTTESMMDGAYNVIQAGSVGIGGIMSNASPDGSLPAAPPSWLGYIWVDEVDATVARAQKLGAKQLVAARDIPGVGRFGIMLDPLGAAFAPFRPAPPPGAQPNPHMSETRGHMAWAELYTSDWQKAWQFYSELLGLPITLDLYRLGYLVAVAVAFVVAGIAVRFERSFAALALLAVALAAGLSPLSIDAARAWAPEGYRGRGFLHGIGTDRTWVQQLTPEMRGQFEETVAWRCHALQWVQSPCP